jgi:hypothetical protein
MNQHCLMFVDFQNALNLDGLFRSFTCDLKGYLGLKVHMILFLFFPCNGHEAMWSNNTYDWHSCLHDNTTWRQLSLSPLSCKWIE